jgi:hypothetical protein
MVHVASIVVAMTAALLCACATGPIETQYHTTGVRFEEWTEIRAAIRKVTSSPVTGCSRPVDSPGRGAVTVWTQSGKTYLASKTNGKWNFREVFIVGYQPAI